MPKAKVAAMKKAKSLAQTTSSSPITAEYLSQSSFGDSALF